MKRRNIVVLAIILALTTMALSSLPSSIVMASPNTMDGIEAWFGSNANLVGISYSPYVGKVRVYHVGDDIEVVVADDTSDIVEVKYLAVMKREGKKAVEWGSATKQAYSQKASEIVQKFFPYLPLQKNGRLTVFSKEGKAYFYRWYFSQEQFPMVEVVFSPNGQVARMGYYPHAPNTQKGEKSAGIDVIYANDGGYWTSSGYMPKDYGEGYCGVQVTWCGPAWARHATYGSPWGKWYTPHAYGKYNLALWVFVPSPAWGDAYYYDQNGYVGYVNQLWYNDVWAAVTWSFDSPRYIKMTRTNGNIYWDEIRIFGGWQ